jgi:hypothetical protein
VLTRARLGIAAVVLVLLVAALVWWTHRPEPAKDKVTDKAPAVGSCWTVDLATARTNLPWQGSAVNCRAAHTVEVVQVAQVDHALIEKSRSAEGDEKKITDNLMYAEARRACGIAASTYLGSSWHRAQVTVLADWIKPASDGFFGCALAQTSDPGGQRVVTTDRSFRGLLAGDGVTPLDISCVSRGAPAGGLTYTPCAKQHDGEFVGVYSVTPANAPFDQTGVTNTVTGGCAALVLSYLGLAKDANRTDLSVGYVGPTSAATWLGSDQTFACYVMAAVKLRGSIRSLGTRPLPH